ncbi:uncharacterized protein LOC112563758 isoform X2 [Pomacea canaliculata]|uniref:uncharacterized protein LOC112563758 isoform X2 n=1 Tax=Pomacea canaliculata TaxID=400727 RepID=UPI000D726330|nr:uncharacterized protein LOC112563758 isoform X2 [Pomacea canaliculata]
MRSGSVQALSKGRGSMGLWKATVFLLVIVVTTSTGQTCDRDIPFDYNGVYVTYSSATSIPINGSEWCPDTSKDNAPYIEFRFEPEGQTAVSKIITTTKDKYNTVGYAATYNIFLSYPPNVKLNGTLLGRKNVSAVRVGESGNITTYYLVFNASVPFETVRIEPISSVDATGGKCMSIYFQGCNTSELCTTACQNGGTCVGQNLCECREGFFGTNCSLTTDDVRQSPIGSRLRLVNVSSTNFVFNKAKFTSSVRTGVSVNLSRIDLNGFGAYLWAKKADLDKPFDCLTNIDLYSAFTMLFRFRVNSFNRDRPSVILATNAFSKTKGVNIFIQNDNGVNSLNVTFRRLNRQWTAIASTEALQTTGQWVDANIRWENSFGLELVLNGKDIGRALVSTSSNNEEAAYLCLGYPSFGYESYDNNINIRDLTIIPTVSSQIRPSIEAGASTLRIEVANGTVSSQQLGPSLRVFSSSGFSSTGTEIRLKGFNVYLTTNNPAHFFDLLLDPSKYQTFTASCIFSVDNVNVVNYIIDTGNYTGVTMYLSANLELVVELKWVLMQYRVTYRFSQIDIPRLTGSGVKIGWSFVDRGFRLYIDDSLKAVSNSPVTTYTLSLATTLYLGFPSSTYNESALLVGLTIRDWKMWLYSPFFVHLPDILDEEVQAPEDGPDEEVVTDDLGSSVDARSCSGVITRRQDQVFHLLFSALQADTPERTPVCRNLSIYLARTQEILTSCWRAAEAGNDSISEASFLHYSQRSLAEAFSTILTVICDGSLPRESSEKCDLTGIKAVLTSFFSASLRIGQGEQECSLLWTERERLAALTSSCGATTKAVLGELSSQTVSMVEIACSHPTCSIDYAQLCVSAAEEALTSVTGPRASGDVCMDVKFSLACITNHTVDCSGVQYLRLSEQTRSLYARYRDVCGVNDSSEQDHQRLSVQHGQWLIQAAAVNRLLPNSLFCSLRYRQEWTGQGAQLSLSPLAYPYFENICNDISATSRCNLTACAATPCGSLSRNCLAQNSSSCAGLNGFESLLSLQKDQDRKCGNASSASLLVSTGRPALDAVLLSFRRADYQGIKDLCQWLPRLRNSLATIQGDDVILEQAISFSSALAQSIENTVCSITAPPDNETNCPAALNSIVMAIEAFDLVVKSPFLAQSRREELCRLSLVSRSSSGCGTSADDYAWSVLSAAEDIIDQVCQRVPPLPTCDVNKARDSLQELVSAFLLPTDSACAAIDRVEVAVRRATIDCPLLLAWPITSVMGKLRELAESTCYRGQCDPAGAVICLIDVHHMAKLPVPDWEGVCSILNQSAVCAKQRVSGCDKCQRDTVDTLVAKVNRQLEDTCRAPPVSPCKAVQAYKCKDVLASFRVSGTASSSNDGLLCMRIFEARKCVQKLTVECDDTTKLAVSIDLEAVVKVVNGVKCEEKAVIPKCRAVLAERVKSILSYDPLDPEDPSYDQVIAGNNTEDQQPETGEEPFVPTYLGRLCQDAHLAFQCVQEGLQEFPIGPSEGFFEILNASWTLALTRCRATTKPLKCYTCKEGKSNEGCNGEEQELCPPDRQMCYTRVVRTPEYQNITISKGCIAPLDCRPGSDGTSQTFCCEGAECNQPDNGPLPATCSLSRVSACLDALSGAVLESNSINCSLVVQQTACFEYVQKECKSNGVTEVSQTLSALLNSSTVQECFVQMSDSRCGLYAATALSSLLATASDDIQDSTLCPMLVAVDRELRLATHSGKCDMEEIIAINSSYALLKSQLWDRKCEGVTESTGACQPLAALDYLIQNIDFALPDCGMEAAWEPFNNLTAGCQPVHLQLIKLYVSTLPAQCNASSVPSLPVDPLFPDACLTDIFPMALANNFSAEDMDRIIPCLIQNWPVDFYMNLPPSYRVYSEQSITFIFDFFDGIRNLFDGILISSNVSERCKSSQEEVARLQAVEVLQMIFLPFAPVSESNAFCKVTKSFEDKISLLLTQKCQDDEVQLQSKLLTYLQTYRLSFCPDEEPAPTCLKSSAQECIVRFTTFMVTAKIDTDEVCRAVNRTLQCVRSYTALCSSEEIKNVSRDMMNIAELYYTCTGVKEFVCENSIIQSFNTSSSITSLDGCGTATGTYSCSFARQAVRCYKDTITAIPAVLQNAVSHFNTKYPLLQEFGKDFCDLDLEFWTIGDQCIKPTCNIDIDSCLTVENSTGETVDTSRPRQCLNERLAGCDVVSRSEAVYKIWHDIEIFTMQYGLNITWSSWSRDSDIMSTMLIMKYISKLEISLRNPKWNLLDICWYFDDLKGIQDALADLDSFLLKSVLERPIRALERSLASGCKDQDILGVILDLPAKEDERCPQELQAELIFALVRSVFAGFQPMDAREQLCETLERLSSVNVTACSLGFQKQVELLKIFIGNLGENMCSPPFYCSLEKAQQCVSEMVAVVQGIGTSSSKNTVCSSLNTFDQCVAHVSFQCDNIIATKIESSVASVRELAVSICSEEDPTPSPDTCKAEIEDGCKQVDARKCSRKQMLALMSPLIDNRRHCRALAYTEDCYNRMSKACNKGNSQFNGFSVRFPPAVIQGLQEQRKCKDPQIYTPALVDCTVNCNVSQATICITTLELELRNFDPLGADDACSFIRVARQCLDSQTSNCSDDISKPLYSRLDSVLEYFSDISSSCKDFSSCLSDLTTLSAKILAAGGNLAANASQVLDNVGEVSLDLLCAQASTVWQCVSTKISLLSSDQYRLVQPIIDPLRKLHDDQCDATVKLRCYHCNGAVLDGTNNKNDKCSNDRACGQKQTRCYEYFEEKESKDGATDILVYRGCMEPQECQERKGQNGFYCCSSEHCNDGEYEDKDPVPELDSCYDRDAVKCAFNYIWALIRQNTVPCRSALANLQCVATYTQACDKDKGLHEAATQLMLTLAQSTCISGPLSPECHPLALLSMNAILTNAYSADSACIAWQQANQSLTVLEAHKTCTALDLVAIRESLSFASVITYTFCHPGDCIMSNSSVSAEAGNSGQDGEGTNAGSGGKPTTVASVDCDYYGASKCGRDALYRLEGIDSSNSEQICNDVKANATCAVKILENCELESPCLKKLLLQVQEVTKEKCGEKFFNPPAESDNSNHTSTSQNATCKPRVMCNLERAMECIDEFSTKVNDTTELCRKLQLAVQCRKENVASCRSLQSILTEPYFKDYRAVLQQCPDVNLNPNPPQDVYSRASVCVQTILQDIYDGIGANYEPEDVFCGATASLGLCDFTVPDLNNNSTLGKFRDHFSLISKDLCTFSDPSKEPGSREKRENGSSNWDLAFALVTVLRSNFFSVIPLEQRPDICKRVNKGLKLLDSYIENITQIALTRSSQIFLQRIQSEGWNQFFTYCSELDWEQSGCRPDYFQTCMKPFWKISALALTENGTLCRRASYALQCIAKFSNGCDMSVTRVVETARLQVQGVVGNICPNLTLGLFCPSKYSLINNFTCSYSSAQTCLSSVNTNAIDRRFDSYCSNLDKSLSCAKNGLEGCLQSQVDTAAVTLSSKKNLNTELSYCKSSTGLANYSSVCIAREPCSVIGAVEHFENAEVSDCRSLASIRTSFESSLQNCNNTQAMIFASGLFLGCFMRFQQQCPSQFQNLPIITSELSEAKITLVKNLFDALVTSRSKSAVCKAFYDYLESVSNITGRIGSPVAALEDEHGYLRQVLDDFCPGDKTGDSLPQPDGCQLYTAALFVVEELIWPLSSSGMPTADNQEACRRWKEQYVRIAVNKYMARCDRSINDLFGDIIELSSRHVAASEMCETTSTCIVAEAFYFINQFSVAVTSYSIDNNTVTLCLKKSEAESHVGAFTATCKDSERAIVSASLAQVMGLVTGVCDQVVLPPQPLCPDIPFTQQTCHVVKALVCLVESNLKLLSLDTFIYSDWCTATQQAMSCIAYNTSGCDSNVEDMKAVSSSLDNLRKQAENRCPWLTPDLCGVSPPCPAEFAGCDIYLQLDLLNNPLDDACSILETAYKCMDDNTRTCTRAQRAVVDDSLKRSMKLIPSVTCNANATDPTSCFLQARAATWQLLTHPNGTANNCQILVNVAECFSSRNVTLPSASLQAALFLDGAIRKSLSKCQGTDPHCGRLTALIINTVYEYISDMATASTFDHVSYCSKRNAILEDTAVIRQLYNQTCSDLSVLDDLEDALHNGPAGSLCDVDTKTECEEIIQNAQKCLDKFNDIDNCSAATELAVCMAPLGLCSENEQLISQYEEKVSQMDVCARLPLVLLRASPKREIYLSEQGGSASISFQVVENYTSYLSSDTNSLRMRLRTEIVNIDPLRCMTNDEAEIPQVVVKGTSNCGILITAADWINQSVGSIELMAVLDGREDGVRRAKLTLYAEVEEIDPRTSSWNSFTESIKLAQYTVAVDNKDSETAVCTSVGYNFFQTFDGSGYSCFETGTFMMYRNKIHHTFVSITVKKSTITAVYTCAVKVGNANVSIEFNRCLSGATRSRPQDISVTMTKSGDYDQISVYRTPDFGYVIVFSIGTIVQIKQTSSFGLTVYIVASTLDFGKTEGLCGGYDKNAYNDFVQPNGQRYTTQANDMQYGVLSPSGFITAWSIDPNEVPQTASGFVSDLAPTCSCLASNTDASQCSHITRVATCDYVQGVDITSALAAASEQSKSAPGGRRRRAVEDTSTAESPVIVPGWPTPSNWTQAMAKERCEKVLLEASNLRYCDKAVLAANGSYSYADIFTVCMEEIRVSDTAANLTSITKHAEYVCFMMFIRNITYFGLNSVRDTVLEFLDTTCMPADCSGNGQCRQGVCECKPGYVGGDCAYQRAKLPVPTNHSLVYGNLCYITDSNRCEDIFVSASQLVESPFLACHIKKVEVDHSGAYQSIGPVSVTKAQLMTASVVQCSWPRTSAQETVAVAISNDGQNPTSAMLISAYDPRCYTCSSSTNYCQKWAQNACQIQGRCYLNGEGASSDNCLYCNPARSATEWTYKDTPDCEVRWNEAKEKDLLSTVHILIIIACITAFAVIVTTVVGIVCKRRLRRKANQQSDLPPPYLGLSDDSSSLSETSFAPQKAFNTGKPHTRAVTQATPSIPHQD